jgi:hypothetical protein
MFAVHTRNERGSGQTEDPERPWKTGARIPPSVRERVHQLSGSPQKIPFLCPTRVGLMEMAVESEMVLLLKVMRRWWRYSRPRH